MAATSVPITPSAKEKFSGGVTVITTKTSAGWTPGRSSSSRTRVL